LDVTSLQNWVSWAEAVCEVLLGAAVVEVAAVVLLDLLLQPPAVSTIAMAGKATRKTIRRM
jgi:hypothetical protein